MRTAVDKVFGDTTGHKDPKPGFHFHLSCYVCGPACVHPSPFEGWADFITIYNRRPDGCRFAIVRQLVLIANLTEVVGKLDDEWLCWDLLDDGLTARSSLANPIVRPPLPMWAGETEDGLIMKAMMRYESEHT